MARKTKHQIKTEHNKAELDRGPMTRSELDELAKFYEWELSVQGYAQMDSRQVTIARLLMRMGYTFDLTKPEGIESK